MIRLLRSGPNLEKRQILRSAHLGRIAMAGVLVAGVTSAGCGSSSKTASTTTAAITKAAFVAKANAICGKADPELSAAGAKLESRPPQAEIAALVKTTYLPSIQAQITSIKALGVPAGEETTVANMLGLAQADVEKIKADPSLIATDAFADFAKVAHPYGLTACAPTS
jgi:uncharacterized protein with PIN domain